ncbi:MAG: signal recognition particle-docking protein FtsY [Actinomycetota bacterium]
MESALIFLTVVILVVIGLLGFVTARRRPSQEAEDLQALREALREVSLEEEALPQDPEEEALLEEELLEEEEALLEKEEIPEEEEEEEEADAGVEVPLEPSAPGAPPKPRVTARLFRGLTKSRQLLGERLASVIRRSCLDEEAWEEIEEALIRSDVGVEATTRIIDRLRAQKLSPADLDGALAEELMAILDQGDRTFHICETGPSVWLVTGVNGTGKTTSVAKLAHWLKSEGRSVVLAAADTFRAAAIDQLGVWAERIDVHMVSHAPGADPGAVIFDAIEYAKARSVDVVLVDTAGRLHTKGNLMEELKKIRRVAERQGGVSETLLVVDATVGQNGIAQARTFEEAVSVTGLVLTKLDGTARGGIVLAVQQELGIPVKAVGVGESLEDLELFDPERFVKALIAGSDGAPD